MSDKDIKWKLGQLEKIIRIATVILYFLELYIAVNLIEYLRHRYFYIGLIVFFSTTFFFLIPFSTDFKRFKAEEVEKWEKMTIKRTIKFIYKCHWYSFNTFKRFKRFYH